MGWYIEGQVSRDQNFHILKCLDPDSQWGTIVPGTTADDQAAENGDAEARNGNRFPREGRTVRKLAGILASEVEVDTAGAHGKSRSGR